MTADLPKRKLKNAQMAMIPRGALTAKVALTWVWNWLKDE